VFTYDLPVADWVRRSLLLEPPPPPITRAEQKAPAPVARARFEAALSMPQAVPRNAVMINDTQSALTSFAAPDIGFSGGIGGAGAGSVFGVIGGISTMRAPDKPIRIGGAVKRAELLHQVAPRYPVEALAENVTGIVKLDAIINREGLIREVKILSGNPLLTASAVEAVEQWRYRPTLLNGMPVEVIIQIEINFKLAELPKEVKEVKKKRR
jgi:protein TonB